MPNVKELASQLYAAFETARRAEGDEFIRLKDGSPEWMTEVIYAAHGDMLPDDWRYRFVRDAAKIISERGDDYDAMAEAIDKAVDVYSGRLCSWFGSHTSRIDYVDDAVSELGWPQDGLIGALQWAQYREREEVYGLVLAALTERATDEDEEA